MNLSSRRWIAGVIRLGLVVVAIALVMTWIAHRVPHRNRVSVQMEEPPPTPSLGPGDVRIYNADSSVDVVLEGDRILAGLSPKTVAKVRDEMNSPRGTDTGLGGGIASLVKKTVAGAIGTHAVYRLADIRDVRFERGRLIFEWTKGGEHHLFGDVKVNDKREGDTFRAEDAQSFIEAVRARKKALQPM